MRSYLWIALIWLVCPWLSSPGGQTRGTEEKIAKILALHPIEAKFEDVEGLLGPPLSKSPDFYKLDELNLLVSYNRGAPCNPNCRNGDNYCGWNVPHETLITLTITVKVPFHQKDLMKLGIDLGRFEKEIAEHSPGVISYTSHEHGSAVIINGNQVESITLFPAKKYHHLRCPQTKPEPVCHGVQRSSAPL